MPTHNAHPRTAWFHVDMDGLDAICRGHGRTWRGADRFYTSAVEQSLRFFADHRVAATYFVIAQDLDDPAKRAAIESVAAAGHEIACHGYRHQYLHRIAAAEKRHETIDAKKKIEDALGRPCQGFRAPGYSIDFESLELLRDAGYRYDTSVFPTYQFRKRLGVQRLFPEPFLFFPEDGFFEIPLPAPAPGLPPFHPCYAFYLSRHYFRLGLRSFSRRFNYLTLLFHLTDFAAPQPLGAGWRIDLFTNNLRSASAKRRFLDALVEPLCREYRVTTTEAFLRDWPTSAPDLNPRTVLGISTTHETGACIVRDGEILAAINEERLSRRKLDNTYPPVRSIEEVIRIAGVRPDEIDAVAIAGLHWKDLLPQTIDSLSQDVRDFHAWNDYFPHFCRVLYRLYYFWRAIGYGKAVQWLERRYGITPKTFYVEHHEAHAAAAYFTGSAPSALVVSADGVGDDVSLTFSRGERSVIRRLQTFFYPHSFGQFYTACTQILGFKAGRHEGKITGLSGFGKPVPELVRKVEGTFFTDDGFKLHKKYYSEGFVRPHWADLKALLSRRFAMIAVDYRNYKPPLARLLRGYRREDVAHAFQSLLERELVRLTQAHSKGGAVDLALVGGVCANVKLNMALSRDLAPGSTYVFPNMGDGGLCVGAALSVQAPRPRPVASMYLGTGYTDRELLEAIGRFPALACARPEDLAGVVAGALADRKIVARFDGRMEFGPRALGNRSILFHCGDKSVNDWLNRQLNRTEFMPFAPLGIWEDAEEYFVVRDGEKRACEFMTLVVPCTPKAQQTCPAAVHVDGTARPQLLRREANPAMYAILERYKALTGISCVINTSFNMHEEPIVRSPEEAITAFQQSHLDYLVLGPFVVWEPARTPALLDRPEAVQVAV